MPTDCRNISVILQGGKCLTSDAHGGFIMAFNDTSNDKGVQAAAQDAKRDFEKVASTLHDKGARDAYKTLAEECQKTKELPVEQRQAWQKEMVSQLSQSHDGKEPILPGLSIAYLEANKRSFSNRYGQISYDKIDVRKTINELNLQVEDLNPKVDKVDNVEAALLDSLSSSPDEKIRKAINEKRDFPALLLTEAVDKDEAETKRTVSLEQTDRNEESVAKGLLANNGKLFDLLDTTFGHEEPDGRISFENVESAFNLFQKYPNLKSVLSQDEIATLDQLNTVFTDENNKRPRAGSIVGHDPMAKMIAAVAPGVVPASSLFVSRETIAGRSKHSGLQETEKRAALEPTQGPNKQNSEYTYIPQKQRVANITFGEAPAVDMKDSPQVDAHPDSGEQVPAAIADGTDGLTLDAGSAIADGGQGIQGTAALYNDRLIVGRGEGYWHVARRMLKGSPEFSNAVIAKVSRDLQAANNNRTLHPNENLTRLLANENVLSMIDRIHNSTQTT